MNRILWIALPLVLLVACGEVNQANTAGNTNRGDSPPWQGAKNEFVAPGWSPGSQNAWATQMRTRVQTQDEYTRVR